MIVVVEIIAGRLMRNALKRERCQLVAIMFERNEDLPSGNTGFHLETTINRKQWILEANIIIPINFFNECRDVGKGREIAMFGKPAIEDFVKFCLCLRLGLGIANHRQKECSNCRSSGICSRWGIAASSKKKGTTVQYGRTNPNTPGWQHLSTD